MFSARFLVKVLISALLVAGVSELGKKSPLWAAVLASLPITSILAMTWLYADTRDLAKVSELSTSILWMVFPSLVLFLAFPILVRNGARFSTAMLASCALTAAAYAGFVFVLGRIGTVR